VGLWVLGHRKTRYWRKRHCRCLDLCRASHKSSYLSYLNSNTYPQLPLSTLHTPSDLSNRSSWHRHVRTTSLPPGSSFAACKQTLTTSIAPIPLRLLFSLTRLIPSYRTSAATQLRRQKAVLTPQFTLHWVASHLVEPTTT